MPLWPHTEKRQARSRAPDPEMRVRALWASVVGQNKKSGLPAHFPRLVIAQMAGIGKGTGRWAGSAVQAAPPGKILADHRLQCLDDVVIHH